MTPVEDRWLWYSWAAWPEWGLTAGPGAKSRRQAVSQHFNLGYTNAKQLQRQLQRYGIPARPAWRFRSSLDQAQRRDRE